MDKKSYIQVIEWAFYFIHAFTGNMRTNFGSLGALMSHVADVSTRFG